MDSGILRLSGQGLGQPRHIDRPRRRQRQVGGLLQIDGDRIETTARLRQDATTDVAEVSGDGTEDSDRAVGGPAAPVALEAEPHADGGRACRDDPVGEPLHLAHVETADLRGARGVPVGETLPQLRPADGALGQPLLITGSRGEQLAHQPHGERAVRAGQELQVLVAARGGIRR